MLGSVQILSVNRYILIWRKRKGINMETKTTKTTNELKVLRAFINEFSPMSQAEVNEMNYFDLWAIVKQIVNN